MSGEEFKSLIGSVVPNITLANLKQKGITVAETFLDNSAPHQQAVLLEYQGEFNPEYWIGLQNFYAITRYNRSPLYAMAVYQLAQEIRTLRDAQRIKEK